MVAFKKDADGTFRLTYQGVGLAVGGMLSALILGISGVVNSTDRFTGEDAAAHDGRIKALEAIMVEHKMSPCHGEVCVQLGRIEERLNSLTREHYDERMKGLMNETP